MTASLAELNACAGVFTRSLSRRLRICTAARRPAGEGVGFRPATFPLLGSARLGTAAERPGAYAGGKVSVLGVAGALGGRRGPDGASSARSVERSTVSRKLMAASRLVKQ